ncbi:MAG TPA: glycoside hydrolase family 3 C-terminal domain-containing protein [Bryobacteraceae bacterium]|nr:glycoside hydrolase family 3 C-terminal domain-containing protein [Bryobacteraceae bacterium]
MRQHQAVLQILLVAGMTQTLATAAEPFRDPNIPLERRVDDLVSRLTLDEKIALLGQMQPAIPRLGIKSFTNFTEGLHGLGWVAGGSVTATTFPQSSGLGETWDPAILRQVGAVEGYEARVYVKKYDGRRVGLAIRAPNVDLVRDPRWGRAEESFGEDPYLVGKMSVGFIQGLQGDNPKYLLSASTMKHFLANSNEDGRTRSSSDFDERNLREYYLVPFQMGIQQAGAQSFMASYNAVNKIPDTVSPFIRDIVEKEWKFDGMVCTDAGSLPNLTRQFHYYPDNNAAVAGCVKAGITVFLDRYADALKAALDMNLVTEADIERNIRGNLRMRMRLGEFDPEGMSPYEKISGSEEPWYSEKNKALARKVTQESIVLLKNSGGLLPLDKSKLRSIAVIGPNANDVLIDWYAGMPPYTVTPLEGIRSKVGPNVRVRYSPDDNNGNAANLAAESDAAIVFVGNHPTCNMQFGRCANESEGKEAVDRKKIELEPAQLNLIRRVKAANAKTVVVLVSSFPYAIGWVQDNVSAILHMAHSSQEEGNALADVLFGDYNPAGRLTATWVKSLDDLPPMMDYDIRKGRTYMYFKGQPLYPFGFGLSYTRFEYSNLRLERTMNAAGEMAVGVDVRNTGSMAGDEVVQLYVSHMGSAVERPLKELRGFERIALRPGETRTVKLPLKGADLTYWDAGKQSFVVEPGTVDIMVGGSSADVRLHDTISVTQ